MMPLEARLRQIATDEHRTHAKRMVSAIASMVAEGTGVPKDAIMGYRRGGKISEARHVVMFEAREQGLSYPLIGWALNRDHSSVWYGVKKEAQRRGAVR